MKRTTARLAIAMIAVPLALAGCGSSSRKAASSAGAGGTPASASSAAGSNGAYGYGTPSTPTTGAATVTHAAGGTSNTATVSLATVGQLGKVLVAADGRTLYLFEKDHGTTTACTGACAQSWPAYTAASPKAGAGLSKTLSTATGEMAHQVVYNGHLLYEFAGDSKPGQANGVGIPDWYAVTAAGTAAE